MKTDISLDLETLSKRNDAAILSIGATEFDRNTGEIIRSLYAEIDIDSAISVGHVDGSTLSWWMRQEPAARAIFNEDRVKLPLTVALLQLNEFVGATPACVWGNGATFDISILETAYNKAMLRAAPWEYWNIRDMRTIVEAARTLGFEKAMVPFMGTKHNALDDAAHQARIISAAWRAVTRLDEFEPCLDSSDVALEDDLIAVAAHALQRRELAVCEANS
jgi:hypothetical protein